MIHFINSDIDLDDKPFQSFFRSGHAGVPDSSHMSRGWGRSMIHVGIQSRVRARGGFPSCLSLDQFRHKRNQTDSF